jgi:Ca2+-binding EF-hand superfamily protein
LVRTKLQYEWKNIFRHLSAKDDRGDGIVPKRQFDEVLRANGVFVSNEELKMLFEKYGDNTGKNINYVQLSE